MAGMVFTSCVKEEELLFEDSAAERLNAASELYCSRLMAQPNGWAMQLYPTYYDEAPYGSGYLVLINFKSDHSAVASMDNALTNHVYKSDVSAWDVITDNGPVLTFNTYNEVIHTFAYPEDVPGTKDDETGKGMEGDYEFVIVDAPEDASYLMLKGKKRGTYNLLTPVEEGVNYEDYLKDVKNFQATMFSDKSPSFAVLHNGDELMKFEKAGEGMPSIYPYDGDAVTQTSFNPFLITKRGNDYYLRFRDKHTYGETTVQEYKYLVDKDLFESVDNPAFYLCGDDPARFFAGALASDTVFKAKKDFEMSESVKTVFDKIYNEYRKSNAKYGVSNYRIKMIADDKVTINCRYNEKDTKTDLSYVYNFKKDGNVVTLEYVGANPADATTEKRSVNHYDRVKEALDIFSQSFKVEAMTTSFDLSYMRMTSTSNPDVWFSIFSR